MKITYACGHVTNLRICGDGPLTHWSSGIMPYKPPHMRRWTVSPAASRSGHRQTSAYAEMDPRLCPGVSRLWSNLRICGDGPSHVVFQREHGSKPPHMRRWTCARFLPGRSAAQTSAYAEMDLSVQKYGGFCQPNLRICGDGPNSEEIDSEETDKPPHMRRWTRICDEAAKDMDQTSAYAEMDPKRTTT